ncbi:uncharacterized [Tachysurus ichikawai]
MLGAIAVIFLHSIDTMAGVLSTSSLCMPGDANPLQEVWILSTPPSTPHHTIPPSSTPVSDQRVSQVQDTSASTSSYFNWTVSYIIMMSSVFLTETRIRNNKRVTVLAYWLTGGQVSISPYCTVTIFRAIY